MKKTINLSLLLVALMNQIEAKELQLDTITVTSATNSKQSIADTTSNISVITSDEIQEKHYTTVTEALNSLSGINFTDNGGLGSSTSVLVRGFDSKRVLVLIDGVRYNDITGMSGAPFEHLMIADIEQIEVVKGAQSGIWGADATAGVINIITKSAKNGLHGFANVEYGSFNTKKYGALASYKADKYYIKASSQKVTTDSFTSRAPRGENINRYEKDRYVNTTSNIKFGFHINETNKIDLSHTLIFADSAYDSANPNSYSTIQTQDSFSSINFNHIDSFNELDVYANRSLFDRNYPQGSTKEYNGEVYEYGAKSKIHYREKDFFIIGVDYKTFEHKNALKKKYENKAVFATNSNEFNGFLDGKTIVTESLRADYYNKFDDKVTGKFGVKHLNGFIEDLIVSANIGTAYNVPTLYNLYSNYGNENIIPENTLSYDASAEYKRLKVTYFESKIKDMIDYDFGISKYNNLSGTSSIKGFEIEYATSITDFLFVKANYTKVEAKNSTNQLLRRRPKESYKASIDYYATDDLYFGANGEYVGKRYDSDNSQGAQTGEYAVVNFTANYDINKNFQTYLKIENALDRYYQVVDGYTTAPRSFYVGLKAQF